MTSVRKTDRVYIRLRFLNHAVRSGDRRSDPLPCCVRRVRQGRARSQTGPTGPSIRARAEPRAISPINAVPYHPRCVCRRGRAPLPSQLARAHVVLLWSCRIMRCRAAWSLVPAPVPAPVLLRQRRGDLGLVLLRGFEQLVGCVVLLVHLLSGRTKPPVPRVCRRQPGRALVRRVAREERAHHEAEQRQHLRVRRAARPVGVLPKHGVDGCRSAVLAAAFIWPAWAGRSRARRSRSRRSSRR